jgi:hypothetical protein
MKEIYCRVRMGKRGRTVGLLLALACLAVGIQGKVSDAAPMLRSISVVPSDGWLWISGEAASNAVVTVEASRDLVRWEAIATLHDSHSEEGFVFAFLDPMRGEVTNRFYRFVEAPKTATNDWKNQIRDGDSFGSYGGGDGWVKFTILMDDPTRVYYADGSEYLFHYDFASTRLDPLRGIDQTEFERIAFYNEGREVVLGAVIFPWRAEGLEYAIQFVSQDPLPRELVRDLFHLVRSTVVGSPYFPYLGSAFYVPSYEQQSAAQADRAWYETNGVPLASADRWAAGNSCYAMGWAIGRLQYFAGDEIEAAYGDGRLLPTDILLTDGVPSEVPFVAGIITLNAATPNSHVAILARSQNVPFVHLVDSAARERALQLVGHEVALQLSYPGDDYERNYGSVPYGCMADITLLDPPLDAGMRTEIFALKDTAALRITPVARFGAYTAPTDALVPEDICFFGGKASNYGLLRRTIPSNAPPAIAISFDLWEEFMTQTLANGKTLRQEIRDRLAEHTYPQRIPTIKTTLASIRALIRQETQFTAGQQEAIAGALRVFDSRRNIRFRSSTNVEDTEMFSGAGLYDSYSGCLQDDLDGDEAGPSHCDPSEDEERGVFRAIRRVYASFYNDNAYLERVRRRVDEDTVGMAILVHHSTPDDIEMANGVATVETSNLPDWNVFRAMLNTQTGATSVANPEGGGVAEEVFIYRPHDASNDLRMTLNVESSLVPSGSHVMEWEEDYRMLGELLSRVADAYEILRNENSTLLDFEYKKVQPGRLEVKQVREIPSAPATNLVTRYLLADKVTFVPRQSVNSGLFATHRLKSKWTFQTTHRRLDETNMAPIYSELSIEHLNGDRVETFTAPVNACGCWAMRSLAGAIDVEVGLWSVPDLSMVAPVHGNLLVTLSDFQFTASGRHAQPQLYVRPGGSGMATTNKDDMILIVDRAPQPDDRRQAWTYAFTNSTHGTFTIQTTYTLGAVTKELAGTLQTRIEGLTSQPIVLTNFYSQTLGLLHLGADRHFLFEPRLEPGLPAATLSELKARNIRLIYVRHMAGSRVLQVWGGY